MTSTGRAERLTAAATADRHTASIVADLAALTTGTADMALADLTRSTP